MRMALGAESRQVVWLFVRRTLIQLALGIVLGLADAWRWSGLLRNIVREVDPRGSAHACGGVGDPGRHHRDGRASPPARRAATRVDPVEAQPTDRLFYFFGRTSISLATFELPCVGEGHRHF